MDVRLDGRVALITGGSRGIGLATSVRMAASGADVVLVARRAEVLEEARSAVSATATGRVHALACDVANAADVAWAVDEVIGTFGRVDILVNNAGSTQIGAFPTITDEMWQADLDLKLFAAIRFARLVWPGMAERRWGRIINVLSVLAKAPKAGSAPTSVSRAAGMALTKVLASEGAPHNILVNALLVGHIDSDQWHRRHAALPEDKPYAAYLLDLAASIPLGRVGEAREFANVACFLASDLASYVSGTSVNVDGSLCPVM